MSASLEALFTVFGVSQSDVAHKVIAVFVVVAMLSIMCIISYVLGQVSLTRQQAANTKRNANFCQPTIQ